MVGTASLGRNTTFIMRTLYNHYAELKDKSANQRIVDEATALDKLTVEAGRELRATSSQLNRTAEAIRAGTTYLQDTTLDNNTYANECNKKLAEYMQEAATLNREHEELLSEHHTLPPKQKEIVLEAIKNNAEGKQATAEAIRIIHSLGKQPIVALRAKVQKHLQTYAALQMQLDKLSREVFARIDDRSKLGQSVAQEADAAMQRRTGKF